jgi:hypothetical protein
VLATLLAAGALRAAQGGASPGPRPEIRYEARVVPSEGTILVTVDLDEAPGRFEMLRFRIDPERHTAFAGDGTLTEGDGWVKWEPPSDGGQLTYTFRIDHLRDSRSYDARGARTWAIFRGDDLVPPARSRFVDGTRTRARIQFVMPESWSVASPHPRIRGYEYRVANEGRAFTRPTGWYALGDLGVIREDVAGTAVAIAGPIRHGLRRLDILALLRLTLPQVNRMRGEPLPRLLVVGAGDPMWRGGLSGPQSIYLHSERPLISSDATSPLLHELIHTAMAARADDAADWIVEGMAEYFSMELLRRCDALSPERFEREIEELRAGKPRSKGGGRQTRSSTERGVLFMLGLDQAIRMRSNGERSLDDVFRVLANDDGKVTLESLTVAISVGTGLDPATVMPETPKPKRKRPKAEPPAGE